MSRSLSRLLAISFLCALALPAARPSAMQAAGSTITMATIADPTFNLWSPNAYAESDVIDPLIFSGVTTWALNGTPRPDLATNWSVSKDTLTWTFNLRHGVKWQDGVPFTAADVAYTFNDIALNPKYPSNEASDFSAIKTVRATGPYTVQFILKTPWAALPSYLAWFAPILPEHSFAGKGNPFQLASFDKQHPIGTGPYIMTSYVPGQSVTLTRNPSYFGAAPKIQTIVFQIIPQATAQITGLLSGSLNYIEVEDPQLLTPLKANPNITLQSVVQQNYYYATLNTSLAQFKDVRVRQALSLAIDKKGLIAAVLKGNGQVATGPISPLQKYYYDAHVAQYPYDPAKAVSLLQQAGYFKHSDGKLYDKSGHPFTIDFTAGQEGYLVPASELIQQYGRRSASRSRSRCWTGTHTSSKWWSSATIRPASPGGLLPLTRMSTRISPAALRAWARTSRTSAIRSWIP